MDVAIVQSGYFRSHHLGFFFETIISNVYSFLTLYYINISIEMHILYIL